MTSHSQKLQEINVSYINNPQIRRTHDKAGFGKTGGRVEGDRANSPTHDTASPNGAHPHSVSIHHAGAGEPKHSNPHHVHVHHADGTHEHSEHANFQEAMDHANSKSPEAGAGLDGGAAEPVEAEMPDGY
jgi:hypothetical protein